MTAVGLPKYAIGVKIKGKIYLVGIGPGDAANMTAGVKKALKDAQVVIGHKDCLNILWKAVVGRETIAEKMTPVQRAQIAVEKASEGKDVAIVSTGDTGIYAIASTFFSYLRDNAVEVDAEVLPGVTVASAAAALLGSPLGHDFAVISLTDQATGWEATRKRLQAAAEADFVVVLYNPIGKIGDGRLKEAAAILLKHRQGETPVGIVSDIATEKQKVSIAILSQLSGCFVEADSCIIIGNAQTFTYNGWMVTPRGYIEGVGY